MVTVLMAIAVVSRLYLTHDREYYEVVRITKQDASNNGAWVLCDCPICHAEEFLATEVECFVYESITSELSSIEVVPLVAKANRVVYATSLRGPPAMA